MEKTALVLAGGGSRGAYQIGVWQALKEMDIQIDIVTGTSVGALNAALVVMDDYDNALALWKSIETSMVLDVSIEDNLSTKQKRKAIIKQFIGDYVKQGGMDAYPLKKLLDEFANEEMIRNSPIELGIVVFDKTSLKPLVLFKEEIKDGQLNDYLLASSSLYPAMKSCEIDGINYIDGGYYDNIPVELALQKGAQRIIAVDLEAIGVVRKQTFAMANDLTFIRSYWDLGSIMVFDHATIDKNIRLGYLDTMKVFGAYEGIAFAFFKGELSTRMNHIKRQILTLNNTVSLTFSKKLQTKKEELFHLNIATFLKRKYGRDLSSRYTTYFQACIESAGEIFEVDCTKLYSLTTFDERLIERVNKIEVPFLSGVELKWSDYVQNTLGLLDKKVRTVYLAVTFKRALDTEKKIDALPLSLFLPDELMGAYYLALLDEMNLD